MLASHLQSSGRSRPRTAVDELPFGGTKQSGSDKEHGTEVLDYYTEQKSVMLGA